MRRAPSSFREADVRRALRAIAGAGKTATAVEIEGGVIKIKIKDGDNVTINNTTDGTNPWDAVDPQ
jgi:hypothetical protein